VVTVVLPVLRVGTGQPDVDFTDPLIDYAGFEKDLIQTLSRVPLVWCPIRKSMQPWIKIRELRRTYAEPCCQLCVVS